MSTAKPPTGVHASRVNEVRVIADIGGTNARFGCLLGTNRQPSLLKTLAVSDFDSVSDAAKDYLCHLQQALGADYVAPRRAALAVATAVQGDEIQWTNSPWRFSRSQLQDQLGLEHLAVLNDFEALALSLPHLGPGQLRAQGVTAAAAMPPNAMLGVVGPGTGLGVAGLKRHRTQGWIALPGEGGHATLAAGNQLESEVLKHLRQRFEHVSAERLLCGSGLPLLHQSLAAVRGEPMAESSSKSIVERALEEPSSREGQTVETFCAWLGSFCGSVALTLGTREGLYIGGGIVPRLGERFFQTQFRARFEAKGRFAPYLSSIPTPVITDTLAALTGAATAS